MTDKPDRALDPGSVAAANIDVDVIIQNVSHDGRTDFVHRHRNEYAHDGADEGCGDSEDRRRPARRRPNLWQSIVGIGCARRRAKMFAALSEEGINIQMITTSEIMTSVVLDEKYTAPRCAPAQGSVWTKPRSALQGNGASRRLRRCTASARRRRHRRDRDLPARQPRICPDGAVTEWPKVLPC